MTMFLFSSNILVEAKDLNLIKNNPSLN